MPLAWKDVADSAGYNALAPDKQQAAKQQYFDTVVAPRVPKESLPEAQSQFFGQADTSPVQQFAKKVAPGSAEASILEGASFGFGDELEGGLAAVDTGLHNLFTMATGGKPKFSAGEAYSAVRDQTRLNASPEKFQADYPGGSQTGLELLGGAVTGGEAGGSIIGAGETVAKRLGRSALTGAGIGGVTGFGSGQDGFVNRAEEAGKGGIFGAAAGGALGVGAELPGPVRRGAGYAAKAFRSVFQSVSGKSPEEAAKTLSPKEIQKYKDMAVDYVKNLIHESGGKIENLTEDAAHKLGKPVTGAEAIGRQGSNQLSSIGRRAGETGDISESQFRLRGDERAERLQENLAKAASVDPRHTQGHIEQLVEDLQTKNDPRYTKAFAKPGPEVEGDTDFQNLASQPNFQDGLAIARQVAGNKQQAIALFKGDDGKWYGTPSWAHLDMIKKAMDSVVTRKHTNGVGKFISDFQSNADVQGVRNFRDWAFEKNPEYKDAVAHAGDTITLRKAYEDAPRLMSSKVTEHQFDKAINDMTPAELEAHKSGWVNDVFNKLNSGRLKPKDLQTPEFMSKSRRMLGETQARQFVDEVGQELRLKAGEQRIPPGRQSITGELRHAGEEMDDKTDEMLHDFVTNTQRRGWKYAIGRTASDIVFDIFRAAKTPEKRVLRDEVGKLLLMKPDQLRAKLEAKSGAPSPKAKEIGKMILHLSTGPVASTTALETTQ